MSTPTGPSVLVVDNYDSFTYNLVQLLGQLGAAVDVVRNDATTVEAIIARRPDRLVVSPGPCTPAEAGISVEAMRRAPEAGIRTLGVCLGHQSLARAYDADVVRHEPIHGKVSTIAHDGRGIYAGLPEEVVVGRYHSLVVDEATLPGELEAVSHGGGVLMGLRHRTLPVEGVQFHPESVLTPLGEGMLRNFVQQDG